MKKPKDLIDRRMASALFTNVDDRAGRSATLGSGGKLALRIVERVMGGVWIGGDAWLTPEQLIFEPNAMNREARSKGGGTELRVILALAEVTRVGWRKAPGTSIIDVETPERTLSLRCYRSKRFAEAIRRAAGLRAQEA